MHCLLFNIYHPETVTARPLGCYRIAHYIREHGWDAEVVEYASYWDLARLQALARSRITEKTRWIGVSHMFSVWSDTMEEFCIWIKHNYPWIRIISGSPANPEFDSKAIDYYIQGYGEHALLELLKYLFSNGPAPRFNLLNSGTKKIIPAISAYPAYPMSSLMVKYQDRDFIVPGESLGVEFSRGCKFQCDYCNFPVLGVKGDYSRDSNDFREQLMDAYDRWGITDYFVTDETFNDRTEKITKFADVVETLPFDPWFTGFIRADLLISRPRDRIELARMGFRGHFYGIESFNHIATKSVGKGMKPDRIKSGLLEIKRYFENTGSGLYCAEFGMIIGLPGETLEEVKQSNQWFKRHYHAPHNWNFYVLAIYQGDIDKPSKLSADFQRHGYEPMPEDVIRQKRLTSINKVYGGEKFKARHMYWRNQHMDIFDAAELEQQFYDEKMEYQGRGTGSWILHAPMFRELSMRERLLIDLSTADFSHKNIDLIENYINKKLSL
jgi:hypothetical protein